MKNYIAAVLGVLSSACFAVDEKSAEIEKLIAEVKAIVEPKTVRGGVSLNEILGGCFSEIQQTADGELCLRLRRGQMKHLYFVFDGLKREAVIPGEKFVLRKGDYRRLAGGGGYLDVACNSHLPKEDVCPWMPQSGQTVFFRLMRSSEFTSTNKVDSFLISLDLRKAYCIEGKEDVPYPFPYVNGTPDYTQEELDRFKASEQLSESTRWITNRVAKMVSHPARSEVCKLSEGEYVSIGIAGLPVAYAAYSPALGECKASLTMWRFDFAHHVVETLTVFGDEFSDSIEMLNGTVFCSVLDKEAKMRFAGDVLERLNLTAKDLPGIDLKKILGEDQNK